MPMWLKNKISVRSVRADASLYNFIGNGIDPASVNRSCCTGPAKTYTSPGSKVERFECAYACTRSMRMCMCVDTIIPTNLYACPCTHTYSGADFNVSWPGTDIGPVARGKQSAKKYKVQSCIRDMSQNLRVLRHKKKGYADRNEYWGTQTCCQLLPPCHALHGLSAKPGKFPRTHNTLLPKEVIDTTDAGRTPLPYAVTHTLR